MTVATAGDAERNKSPEADQDLTDRLKSAGHGVGRAAHLGSVQAPAEWQDLGQQTGADAVGHTPENFASWKSSGERRIDKAIVVRYSAR